MSHSFSRDSYYINNEPEERNCEEIDEESDKKALIKYYPITDSSGYPLPKEVCDTDLKRKMSDLNQIAQNKILPLEGEFPFIKEIYSKLTSDKNEINTDLLTKATILVVLLVKEPWREREKDRNDENVENNIIEELIKYCIFKNEGLILNRIYYQAKYFDLMVGHSGILLKFFKSKLEELLNNVNNAKENNLRLKVLKMLVDLSEKEEGKFIKCLIKRRFDKFDNELGYSLILGDEGGMFLLLNSLESESEKFIIQTKRALKNYLDSKKEKTEKKVIIGEGSYGKVRLAICIISGKVICVKKFRPEKSLDFKGIQHFDLKRILHLTLFEYMRPSIPISINYPKILDMASTINIEVPDAHKKGYIFMKIFPYQNAELVFRNSDFFKWDFIKPYILGVMKSMLILLDSHLFYPDLKLNNTLFNTKTLKTYIIDMGGIFKFNPFSVPDKIQFHYSYCAPELKNFQQNGREIRNNNFMEFFPKCMSFSCGKLMESVLQNHTGKKIDELDKTERGRFCEVMEKLIIERITLPEAIKKINSIFDKKEKFIEKYLKCLGKDDFIKKIVKEFKEKLREKPYDFEKFELLGYGQQGFVFKVPVKGKVRALKASLLEHSEEEKLQKQYELLSKKSLNRALEMHSTFPLSIKIEGISLKFHMIEMDLARSLEEEMRVKKFSSKEFSKLFRDLCEGILLLHREMIWHANIKPSNIFYKESIGSWVLADFGRSQSFSIDEAIKFGLLSVKFKTTIKGTPKYLSPLLEKAFEKIQNDASDKKYSVTHDPFKTDIYALGKTLQEVCKGTDINFNPSNFFLDENEEKRPNIFQIASVHCLDYCFFTLASPDCYEGGNNENSRHIYYKGNFYSGIPRAFVFKSEIKGENDFIYIIMDLKDREDQEIFKKCFHNLNLFLENCLHNENENEFVLRRVETDFVKIFFTFFMKNELHGEPNKINIEFHVQRQFEKEFFDSLQSFLNKFFTRSINVNVLKVDFLNETPIDSELIKKYFDSFNRFVRVRIENEKPLDIHLKLNFSKCVMESTQNIENFIKKWKDSVHLSLALNLMQGKSKDLVQGTNFELRGAIFIDAKIEKNFNFFNFDKSLHTLEISSCEVPNKFFTNGFDKLRNLYLKRLEPCKIVEVLRDLFSNKNIKKLKLLDISNNIIKEKEEFMQIFRTAIEKGESEIKLKTFIADELKTEVSDEAFFKSTNKFFSSLEELSLRRATINFKCIFTWLENVVFLKDSKVYEKTNVLLCLRSLKLDFCSQLNLEYLKKIFGSAKLNHLSLHINSEILEHMYEIFWEKKDQKNYRLKELTLVSEQSFDVSEGLRLIENIAGYFKALVILNFDVKIIGKPKLDDINFLFKINGRSKD